MILGSLATLVYFWDFGDFGIWGILGAKFGRYFPWMFGFIGILVDVGDFGSKGVEH